MSRAPNPNEPRSFRLSRGPSDLGTLFLVLAFGLLLIIAPLAARWVFRTVLLVVGLALLQCILALRGLRPPALQPAQASDRIGTAILLVAIALWLWVIARMFIAGNWIDATLALLVVPQVLYIRWLHIRHAPPRQ